ncbi:MAG: acyl-CoA reductase [Saprospiraceae bacterium]|nr:acyl-CoA reductase [Saprospiraceae bacterium]
MTIKEAFVQLGKWIGEGDEELEKLVNKASIQNAWFTPENITTMLSSIQRNYLEANELDSWLGRYPERLPATPAKVALILAGNLPLVGFHDVLCVLISGHHALVKLSEKDDILLPGLLRKMEQWYPPIRERITFVDRIVNFDAVIATGSNQSAANFERYFSRYPNIIRKNRNSVAILTGHERSEDMKNLGNDIFSYFGLGCRNVSKLYVPQRYDFVPLVKELNSFKDVVNHSKYKNNYDYHLASALIGNQNYMSNDCLLLIEEDSIAS